MPKKAVYLRFERISRKKAWRLLRMSKKSSNFAVALCALTELICNNNYNNIANTKFKNDNSDNVALESILLERSGNTINIANTKFKNDNSDNIALESMLLERSGNIINNKEKCVGICGTERKGTKPKT